MPHELRFTPPEHMSPRSQKRCDCLRINFDYGNAALKAKLKALGMRWAPEGKPFDLQHQAVLGHARIKTTEVHTHLPRYRKPASLLDDLERIGEPSFMLPFSWNK